MYILSILNSKVVENEITLSKYLTLNTNTGKKNNSEILIVQFLND